MIARLQGILIERGISRVIVDAGGVGYDVAVSAPTLAALPEAPAPVTLRIFTHVGEGILALYGFSTPLERELFDLLISVSSVGPSTAMGILSGLAAAELASAISRADLAVLVKVRGVGRKTAERLVLELREKCALLLATHGEAPRASMPGSSTGAPPSRGFSGLERDVVSALSNLGYRASEAEAAVASLELADSAAASPSAPMPFEELFRAALRALRR